MLHHFKKLAGLLSLLAVLSLAPLANSASVEELQAQIADRNKKIQELEKEIAAYQKNVATTQAQANTLKGEIGRLDNAIKKISADIRLTQTEIEKTNLTIEKLSLEIGRKDQSIGDHKSALTASLRKLNSLSSASFLEMALAEESMTRFWEEENKLATLQNTVVDTVSELRTVKADLEDKKTDTESEKRKLVALRAKLADQQKIEDQNKKEKNRLLAQTQNEEAGYRKLLADRQAQKAAFEQELFQFESQLKIAIDPSRLPDRGKILRWPLDGVFITQYFGRTVDAARLYVSGTHNGIDLRAAVGTPVKAAAAGVVTAIGNTDAQPGCYSYGKWVLINHNNGLSTLYAHLSLHKAIQGQTVAAGELIGYSGNTGYATGPHLHFTVYATQGVRVQQYVNSINCKNVTIPIADPKAYLDPLMYL